MVNTLNDKHTKFVKDVVKKLGYKKFRIEVQGETEKGDNYLGYIKFLTVREEDGSKRVDFVLKTAQTNENFRSQAPIRTAYLREIYMYNTIFPKFGEFQEKRCVTNEFTGFARMFGSIDIPGEETLLLENLKQDGYKLWNRKQFMNAVHVEIVFKEYAKLHAVSFAMKTLKPHKYRQLTHNLKNIFEGSTASLLGSLIASQFAIAFDAVKDSSAEVRGALGKAATEAKQFLGDEIRKVDEYSVVRHADCWTNNILFKYENQEEPLKPTKTCFIDWQVAHTGAPVYDLAYFFFVCASLDVLEKMDKYLAIYHETLSQNLREFGCDPDKLYPLSILEEQWKKYAKYGFYMALIITNVLLGDAKDAVDFAQTVDEDKNILNAYSEGSKNAPHIEEFKKRIVGLATFMAENQLL